MGSGVSFSPAPDSTHVQSKLKRLMANKKNMDKLFKTIATIGKDRGRVDKRYDINYAELINYFAVREDSQKNEAFKSFETRKEVIYAAFNYVAGSSHSTGISRKQFRLLLPTLFLFSEIWKVFEVVDDNVDDRRIFKGEFLRAYTSFQDSAGTVEPTKKDRRLSGVKVDKQSVTEEEWEREFSVLDKDKNGHISFLEFCSYAANHVISPMDFIDTEPAEDSTVIHSVTSDVSVDGHLIVTPMGDFTNVWDAGGLDDVGSTSTSTDLELAPSRHASTASVDVLNALSSPQHERTSNNYESAAPAVVTPRVAVAVDVVDIVKTSIILEDLIDLSNAPAQTQSMAVVIVTYGSPLLSIGTANDTTNVSDAVEKITIASPKLTQDKISVGGVQ